MGIRCGFCGLTRRDSQLSGARYFGAPSHTDRREPSTRRFVARIVRQRLGRRRRWLSIRHSRTSSGRRWSSRLPGAGRCCATLSGTRASSLSSLIRLAATWRVATRSHPSHERGIQARRRGRNHASDQPSGQPADLLYPCSDSHFQNADGASTWMPRNGFKIKRS
jgi:hypothetical protein